MQEHLGGHLADFLSLELGIPHKPRTSTEIEGHLTETVVHGQAVAVSLNATLVAKGFQQTFADGEGGVLDGVVFVHMKVALGMHCQVHHSVLADLFEHVVEESQAGFYVAFASAVEVYTYVDVGLFGRTAHFCGAFPGKEYFGNLIPCHAVAPEDK